MEELKEAFSKVSQQIKEVKMQNRGFITLHRGGGPITINANQIDSLSKSLGSTTSTHAFISGLGYVFDENVEEILAQIANLPTKD